MGHLAGNQVSDATVRKAGVQEVLVHVRQLHRVGILRTQIGVAALERIRIQVKLERIE